MKILDIDCGLKDSRISIKDLEKGIVRIRNFNSNEYSMKEILDLAYYYANNYSVNQIHIDTNGYGIVAYDYFNGTYLKEKVISLRGVRLY